MKNNTFVALLKDIGTVFNQYYSPWKKKYTQEGERKNQHITIKGLKKFVCNARIKNSLNLSKIKFICIHYTKIIGHVQV